MGVNQIRRFLYDLFDHKVWRELLQNMPQIYIIGLFIT